MEDGEVRDRIRRMLETGDLPCEDRQATWAGDGEGQQCAACAAPIAATEIEFEVILSSGTVIRLHRLCHGIWLEECEPLTRRG
ncbi:MAG: hypothetical protein ACREJG_08720 [Candidatus Rokuibacteriota bacterium]